MSPDFLTSVKGFEFLRQTAGKSSSLDDLFGATYLHNSERLVRKEE